jgi:HSP20 family protein
VSNDLPIRQETSGAGSPLSQRRPGGFFSDLLGFDPLRGVFPPFSNAPGSFGVEVARSANGYTVEIPVAGFRPDQIEVTFQEDTLIVSGKSERRNFTRQLVLPEEIDSDNITAQVDHGLLTLNLSRRPETQPRRIQVTSNAPSSTVQAGPAPAQPAAATANGSSEAAPSRA